MERLIIIGNTKMNLCNSEIKNYIADVNKVAKKTNNTVGICLPFLALEPALKMADKKLIIYAENCAHLEKGSLTGEVSAKMLKDIHCDGVVIGHSERRNILNETDDQINKKVKLALKYGLRIVLCVGETQAEKEKNKTKEVLTKQIKTALQEVEVSDFAHIIIAYEPVWAVGVGNVVPSANELKKIVKHINDAVFSLSKTTNITIIYGGSMDEKNGADIIRVEGIDGGLIGRACLDTSQFEKICNLTRGE